MSELITFLLQIETFVCAPFLIVWGLALVASKTKDQELKNLYRECCIILGVVFLITMYSLYQQ